MLIPAGTFIMGSNEGVAIEGPAHEVRLSSYLLDQFEVSNEQYRACVENGACTQTSFPNSFTVSGYRDELLYNDYPIVGVTWDQAFFYCNWAGKRLPTEAEWEYAARGPENLQWPWGNSFDPSLSAASAADVRPVDSYPKGVSPFGIYNMAGNVAEWVVDVYDGNNFYANSPVENPVNMADGLDRVFRGGSFDNVDGSAYLAYRRYAQLRTFTDVDIGFRCAADAPTAP
jgi:formylglycine-generating enzyme required for sulfatase activity